MIIAAIEDKEARSLMRELFTKIAQANPGLTWRDNSSTASVPYLRLLDSRGVAVATAIYTVFLATKPDTWSKRWHYEIYSPTGALLYAKAYTLPDFVSSFKRAIDNLVIPHLKKGKHPKLAEDGTEHRDPADERAEHRELIPYRHSEDRCGSGRCGSGRDLFAGRPRITFREISLKDVSEKPIKYVDLSDAIIATTDDTVLRTMLYNRLYYDDDDWASQGILLSDT